MLLRHLEYHKGTMYRNRIIWNLTRKANNYHTVGKKRFKQWWSTIHQYQQNEQSQLTSTHWTEKKTQHMLKIHVLHLDRHNNVMGHNLSTFAYPLYILFALYHIFLVWAVESSKNPPFNKNLVDIITLLKSIPSLVLLDL
jgi:hypothetical protein